jgi:hypothetical protein
MANNSTKKKTAKKGPTSAKQWKGKIQAEGTDLELPSDNVARVRQISPQAFLASGMIPDPLRPMIQKAINSKKGLPPSAPKEMMDNPELIAAAAEMFDRTLCYVMVEPEVVMPPTCTECGEYANTAQHERGTPDYHRYNEGPRDSEVLYADQIDLTDKQFVFNWALGGTRQLETFRDQIGAVVGPLQDEQGLPDQAV